MFKKYHRRFLRILLYLKTRIIRRNIHLKPIAPINKLINDEFVCLKEIFPSCENKLIIPDRILKYIPDYVESFTESYIPGGSLAKVNKGRVFYDQYFHNTTIITPENKYIADKEFIHNNKFQHSKNDDSIVSVNNFAKPITIPGKVFSFTSGSRSNNNYFHWIFDLLPRYGILENSEFLQQIEYYVFSEELKERFQLDSLKQLNIDQNRILYLNKHSHIQADELFFTSHLRGLQIPFWTIHFLKKHFLLNTESSCTENLIYISRRDAGKRNIINENLLEDSLMKKGFKIKILGGMSFMEQVEIFQQSDFIISVHGAALTNLVFCREKTKILEIFPKNYVYPLFTDLANKCNLDYHYYIGECIGSGVVKDVTSAQQEDIVVSDDIYEQIDRILLR